MADNVIRLQSSVDTALERMIDGWSRAQLAEHVALYNATLATIESYLNSPRSDALHPDAARFWRAQIATFSGLARKFNQVLEAARGGQEPVAAPTSAPPRSAATLAARFAGDRALDRVRQILATSSAPAWFRLRADLAAQIGGVCEIPSTREYRALRLRELEFVCACIECPEILLTSKGAPT